MKNGILRFLALVLFVILPIIVVVKTPVLKQFYCSKTDNTCILRIYNTFDQKPNVEKTLKISDIKRVQKGNCKEWFGLYTDPCISVETLDTSYVLDYSFEADDVDSTISDFKKYLKDPKQNIYKLIADKDIGEINIQLTAWGVIILMGLLISLGIITDKKKR